MIGPRYSGEQKHVKHPKSKQKQQGELWELANIPIALIVVLFLWMHTHI